MLLTLAALLLLQPAPQEPGAGQEADTGPFLQNPEAGAFEQEPLAKGISVAEDAGLTENLERARAFLAEQRWEAAVGLLQQAVESDPALLVRSGRDAVLAGGAATARALLLALPEAARAARETLFGERAAEELQAALLPPDLDALQRIAWRYAGMQAGERAARAAAELWVERGETGLSGDAPLPPELLRRLPPAGTRSAARVPAVSGPQDPRLPRLRPADLPNEPSWSFDFSDRYGTGSQPGHRMVFGNGLGFLTDGSEVVALELGTGRPRWRYAGPRASHPLDAASLESMRDATSEHLLHMPVLHDGVLLAVLQEPVAVGDVDSYSRIDIRRVLPARRLYAFDAADGRVLWRQEVPWMEGGGNEPREFAAGPPAIDGGRVFLPVYDAVGTVDLSLLCLDLRTGERLWKRFLISGQLVSNLFGNVLFELAVPPPVAADGRVLVCSHLGGVHALDAGTGALQWTRLYERMAVRTFESGRTGRRLPSFAMSPPLHDGEHWAVAPVDGAHLLVLDPRDGSLVRAEPARATGGRVMRSLIGMDREGVWTNGSRLAFVPFDERAVRWSEPVTSEQSSYMPNPYGGLLVRGEVLVPGRRGMWRFGWRGLDPLGAFLEQPRGEYQRLGTLQATHGLLLVMRGGGVDAYASPDALLETLLADDLDAEQLRTILPLLEQFGFTGNPEFAQRVGDAALRLADDAGFRDQADSLRLLACRSLLVVDALDRALPVLAGLLDSEDPQVRYAAAGALLEVLPARRPEEPRLAEAVELLRRERPAEVPLPDQRREPLGAVLARADLLAALRGKDEGRLREQLVHTLLLRNPGGVAISGMPLHTWADRELRRLTANPTHLRALEEQATQVFRSDAAGAAELRAYAPTRAARAWLRARLDATAPGTAERIQVLRWCRGLGGGAEAWPELAAAIRPAAPERLPAELQPLARLDFDDDRLLAVTDHQGDTVVYLQTGRLADVRILRMRDGRFELVAQQPLLPDERGARLPPLADYAYPTEDGVALLFGDLWLHLGADGSRRERVLPARIHSSPVRVGDFAAVLLAESVDRMRLQVLDLRTGAVFHEEVVPRMVSQLQTMVANDRWLFLLQDRSTRVVRVDLLQDLPSVQFVLPMMATETELRAVTGFGDGVALAIKQTGRATTVRVVRPTAAPVGVDVQGSHEAEAFRPAYGYAWLQRSTRTTSRPGEREPAELYWLPPGAPGTPWRWAFEHPRVEVPQVPPYWVDRERQADQQTLALLPGRGTSLDVLCLELGVGERWTTTLDGIDFADLVTVLPEPRRAGGGWALLLPRNDPSGNAPRMDLVLLDDSGTVLAREALEARTRDSRSRSVQVLDDHVVLRNGKQLVIYGNR